MKFLFLLVFTVCITTASVAQWVPWQIRTPRQSSLVSSDGTTITFSNVDLPIGMRYRVHASGSIGYNSSNEVADACYFNTLFLHIAPDLGGKLGLKVRTSPSAEDWYYNSTLNNSYNSNHTYDASIASAANPLAIRYFDTGEPSAVPQNYMDNSGAIFVEVAQETPRLAVQFDTVYFKDVPINTTQFKLDSVEAYGVLGYNFTSFAMTPAPPVGRFDVSSQRTVSSTITETTNEFMFTYAPTKIGGDTALFHIMSNNAYLPDQHRVIVLIGNGIGASITHNPDTLDFGVLPLTTSKMLVEKIFNSGGVGATVQSITMTPSGSPFAFTPSSGIVAAKDSLPIAVTFTPIANGVYLSEFICSFVDGSSFKFYAKGAAGSGRDSITKRLLDFGYVLLNQSVTLQTEFRNVDKVFDLNVVRTYNSNPAEYSISGTQTAKSYSPSKGEIYFVTFRPVTHLSGWQNHAGSFTWYFSDGTSDSIVFKGADHAPINTKLAIDSNYYTNPGKLVEVVQRLVYPLDSTLVPERMLVERIHFDPKLLDLIKVDKAALVSSSDWTLTATPGNSDVSILLTSTTERFGPSGPLLRLTFRVHDDAQYTTTYLPQDSINLFDPIEAQAITSPGRIIIGSNCTPVRLTNSATAPLSIIDQNSPNPFSRRSEVLFTIAGNGASMIPVKLYIVDAMGRIVQTLVDEPKESGTYRIMIDAATLPAGVYTYILETPDERSSRSMVVVK